jgi:hypothetical protein
VVVSTPSDRHQAGGTSAVEPLIEIVFHGRSEGLETVRHAGTAVTLRGPCGIFVDAYTARIRPDGWPLELWPSPRADFQPLLDLWLAEPGQRSALSLFGDGTATDDLTISHVLARLNPYRRIVYRPQLVNVRDTDPELARLGDAWWGAAAARPPGGPRASPPGGREAWLDRWLNQQADEYAVMDPALPRLALLSPEQRARAHAARQQLRLYLRRHDLLRWRIVAYARDVEAAAWVEVLHAVQTGATARACAGCARYFIRPRAYKTTLCRHCDAVLRRVWRKRAQLWKYPVPARSWVMPIFWHRPDKAARSLIPLLNSATTMFRKMTWGR